MATSNFKSAVTMGFFAAAIGLVVICYASLEGNKPSPQDIKAETHSYVIAQDVIVP